ncbi:MAG: SDR family NAD(P)-dependent oxidoreductase [Flavobacterium sp.]
MRLDHKVSLITGANKGIGFAVVSKFLSEGSIVYAGVRKKDSISEELQNLQEVYPNKLIVVELDVTNASNCKDVVLEIKSKHQTIDVLVNNAGKVTYELLPFINYAELEEMIHTNILGVIRLTQLVSRIMTRNNKGSIINISSIVSVKGAAGQASYAATKGAVNSFTLSVAKELAKNNVRVNAVAPGMVSTERLVGIASEKFNHQIEKIGFGKMAEPSQIADICLFLASEESNYITGQIIGADGSLSL